MRFKIEIDIEINNPPPNNSPEFIMNNFKDWLYNDWINDGFSHSNGNKLNAFNYTVSTSLPSPSPSLK